ncbi:CASP-like protein 4A4 [Rhodamnia argentea]|uniref:CASP-like protein n=1 Tax=Rhodamnia argentea TaxID=178133 RepID=A0ABM3HWI9_9MYRT|nr:CASP-like protein 4A4 [Rhodamnia argentea]
MVIAPPSMDGASPAAFTQQLPTPSPFSFSVASTRWTVVPPIQLSILFLRFLALLLSFVSALALTTPLKKIGQSPSSCGQLPELMYCFIVTVVAFVYSAFQLFKGVCDISYRGILISDRFSDYLSFILDQLVAYLLISSSSLGIQAIQRTGRATPLCRASVISISMSFAVFLVTATCALLSGYKLCKRIIW